MHFFWSNNNALIKCVMEDATNRYTQTERNVTLECEAAICPAPATAEINPTNIEIPYVQFSFYNTW